MEKQQLQQTQRLEELKLLMAQQEKQLNMSQVQIDKQRERDIYIYACVILLQPCLRDISCNRRAV
jgi:hypothetical protein